MEIKDLLKEDSIILGANNRSKQEAIQRMIEKHYKCGHIQDKELFKKAILAREKVSSTGVGNLIAIPHAQDATVNYPSIVAMVDRNGIEFDALDNRPVKILFMIAVPSESKDEYLEIIAQLSQLLMNNDIIEALLNAISPKQFIKILTGELKMQNKETVQQEVDIVAVTACPTGVAHTYMAAKALEDAAKKMNIRIKVETNGASGIQNCLTYEDIKKAKAIIIAADKKVETERFKGKRVINVPVSESLYVPETLIKKALMLENDIEEIQAESDIESNEILNEIQTPMDEKNKFKHIFWSIYKHLMNAISNLIPYLMITGIIGSIPFILQSSFFKDIYSSSYSANLLSINIAQFLNLVVSESLSILILMLLGAYIADSIGGKAAFTVAFITIFNVATMSNFYGDSNSMRIVTQMVLEAILIGYMTGYIVIGLNKIFSKMPKNLHSIIPNLLTPLMSIVIVSLICINVFLNYNESSLISNASTLVSTFMETDGILPIIIGLILGAMMAIDMGGPINKVAYTFGMISILLKNPIYMSAVMIAGMIPPIMIGITMIVAPKCFKPEELKNKWACIVKGLCFISEEAIPYMLRDRKGFHVPCVIASGVAGALSVYFGCSQLFPHGGIWTLPLITNYPFFVIVLVASVLIGMTLIILLKKTED